MFESIIENINKEIKTRTRELEMLNSVLESVVVAANNAGEEQTATSKSTAKRMKAQQQQPVFRGEKVKELYQLLVKDGPLQVREIAERLKTKPANIHNVLHNRKFFKRIRYGTYQAAPL